MSRVRIEAGPYQFDARWEDALAPQTCRAFRNLLPFSSHVIQARWSGESGWVPLGTANLGVPVESPVHAPPPGALLFYPGGVSETEILFPYGTTRFASVFGPQSGDHFLSITAGTEQLAAFGQHLLWQGALPFVIRERGP